jgi:hypothetical protein
MRRDLIKTIGLKPTPIYLILQAIGAGLWVSILEAFLIKKGYTHSTSYLMNKEMFECGSTTYQI